MFWNSPDGKTTIFKQEYVAQHEHLKQKAHIQPKSRWKTLPLPLLLPYPVTSCLASPLPKPSHTHHHSPFSPLFSHKSIPHVLLWNRCRQSSRNRKQRGSVHPWCRQKERKHEMRLKIKVSLGERETLKGLKIASQTKTWIKQSECEGFLFFFKRKPLYSLSPLPFSLTQWLPGC